MMGIVRGCLLLVVLGQLFVSQLMLVGIAHLVQ